MGLSDFFKPSKTLENIISEINPQTTLSENPYATKYDRNKMGIDNIVYLLYCDYADACKWIKDCKKPDLYFSNYDKALQILEVLDSYRKVYHFERPTPDQQLKELKHKYSEYTINFIRNFYNATLESAEKLKTENGKLSKIQSFFDCMDSYSFRFNPQISEYIIFLKSKAPSIEPSRSITLKCGKYILSTLNDINNIPNTDTEIVFALQKVATEFKRNKQMDLAIACLRKSNELSDHEQKPLLMKKDYFRLVKYLQYAGLKDEADTEEKLIYKRHPEFMDKRISNLTGIREGIKKNLEYRNDLVCVSTSPNCPICGIYNNKIYSISGISLKYPKLPKEISEEGGFCPNCYLRLLSYFEEINTPPK